MGAIIKRVNDKFLVTNTVSDDTSAPLTLKEAIARVSASEILNHREKIIEYYMTFPHGWGKHGMRIWTCNEQGRNDYFEFILAVLKKKDYWKIIEETYNEIYDILNDDNSDYKPYREIKWIGEILNQTLKEKNHEKKAIPC
ncbi:MAG: hypothetical protein WC119_00315 [Synergistaceae bacterium]